MTAESASCALTNMSGWSTPGTSRQLGPCHTRSGGCVHVQRLHLHGAVPATDRVKNRAHGGRSPRHPGWRRSERANEPESAALISTSGLRHLPERHPHHVKRCPRCVEVIFPRPPGRGAPPASRSFVPNRPGPGRLRSPEREAWAYDSGAPGQQRHPARNVLGGGDVRQRPPGVPGGTRRGADMPPLTARHRLVPQRLWHASGTAGTLSRAGSAAVVL